MGLAGIEPRPQHYQSPSMTEAPATRVMNVVTSTLRHRSSHIWADRRLTAPQFRPRHAPVSPPSVLAGDTGDTIFGADKSMVGRPNAHTNMDTVRSRRPQHPREPPRRLTLPTERGVRGISTVDTGELPRSASEYEATEWDRRSAGRAGAGRAGTVVGRGESSGARSSPTFLGRSKARGGFYPDQAILDPAAAPANCSAHSPAPILNDLGREDTNLWR